MQIGLDQVAGRSHRRLHVGEQPSGCRASRTHNPSQAPSSSVRIPQIAPDNPDVRPELGRWLPSYLLLAAIWGTSFLFIKVGVSELHPLWLTFGRVLAGAAMLLAVLAVTRDRLPRDPVIWGHLTVVATLVSDILYTVVDPRIRYG